MFHLAGTNSPLRCLPSSFSLFAGSTIWFFAEKCARQWKHTHKKSKKQKCQAGFKKGVWVKLKSKLFKLSCSCTWKNSVWGFSFYIRLPLEEELLKASNHPASVITGADSSHRKFCFPSFLRKGSQSETSKVLLASGFTFVFGSFYKLASWNFPRQYVVVVFFQTGGAFLQLHCVA